jgi:hypothetical protein
MLVTELHLGNVLLSVKHPVVFRPRIDSASPLLQVMGLGLQVHSMFVPLLTERLAIPVCGVIIVKA